MRFNSIFAHCHGPVERGSVVPDFQRLISVEGWYLLDRFNLLKPLVVPPGLLEACVEVEQQDRFPTGATGVPSRC